MSPVHVPDSNEFSDVLHLVVHEIEDYLGSLETRPVRAPDASRAARSFRVPLPEDGSGATAALRELIERGSGAAITTAGPRCFHFVVGGSTPASVGGDLWTAALDQIAYAWVVSPLGIELELVVLDWLRDLFGIGELRGGVITTGATMANFTGLICARQWWAERHGVDVAQDGFVGLPEVPVFTSGFVHASSFKALGMLGMGRSSVRRFSRDDFGRLDVAGLEQALEELDGKPAILIANAGEVNAGEFDPVEAMADLAERHGAWLHVDGAFGLFAQVSPRTAYLTKGVERADSICVDGHKWLNVPYDCGFAFVRDPQRLGQSFVYDGAYLPDPDGAEPVLGSIGPESSRRARSLAVWAMLRAYGRSGVRAMIEGHLDLAQHLAGLVDKAPDLERLADVPLCIVCFRCVREGASEAELDALNAEVGAALIEDGRYYVGTTKHLGRTALRPAIVNWMTRREHIDGFVDTVRELGARCAAGA